MARGPAPKALRRLSAAEVRSVIPGLVHRIESAGFRSHYCAGVELARADGQVKAVANLGFLRSGIELSLTLDSSFANDLPTALAGLRLSEVRAVSTSPALPVGAGQATSAKAVAEDLANRTAALSDLITRFEIPCLARAAKKSWRGRTITRRYTRQQLQGTHADV